MWENLYPDERCHSAYEIDYRAWYEKGKRALVFDIDNTLVRHGAPADAHAEALFRELHAIGFQTCLISNNKEERVRPFAEAVGAAYLWKANKPAPRGYLEACRRMHVSPEEALFIGDQIFTDIWGARKAGITSILVDPIHPKEEIQIVLKRRLEFFVLRAYERRLKKQKI